MQDPKRDIVSIITTLCTTTSASQLEQMFKRYFTSDAKFIHPLCKADSRNETMGLFEWYRLISPNTQLDVTSVMYDSDLDMLVVEVVQKLNIRFSLVPTGPGMFIIRLKLRKVNGLHYIAEENDMCHPIDLIRLIASPAVLLAMAYCKLNSLLINLMAGVVMLLRLSPGLQGGNVNFAGLLEGVGLVQVPDDGKAHNGWQ